MTVGHAGYTNTPQEGWETEADAREWMQAQSERGVAEDSGLYSGYERTSDTVSGKGNADLSVGEPVDSLFDQAELFDEATTKTKKAQGQDILFVRYKQVAAEQISIGLDVVKSPEDTAHVMAPGRKFAQEHFMLLVLDENKKLISVIRHFIGMKGYC